MFKMIFASCISHEGLFQLNLKLPERLSDTNPQVNNGFLHLHNVISFRKFISLPFLGSDQYNPPICNLLLAAPVRWLHQEETDVSVNTTRPVIALLAGFVSETKAANGDIHHPQLALCCAAVSQYVNM